MLIDPGLLREEGLLSAAEARAPHGSCFAKIAYGFAQEHKGACLRRAYAAFSGAEGSGDYADFCRRERYWLPDFALYGALKAHFGGKPWWEWEDEGARMRRPSALRRWREQLGTEISYRVFEQYLFEKQLRGLRARLQERGIRLIGDIPFYVARDSADVWAHPDLFCLRGDLSPRLAAGVPPDFFSEDGQLWGNPVYDWDVMAQDGYRYWIRRLARCAALYDITRLDHFRAFDSYYVIRGGSPDARRGRWRRGPGLAFFEALRRKLPHMEMIGEDLGDLTPSVHELRRALGLPGMRVLQFAFTGGADNPFLPHNYERHTVAYLGTHDNDTTAGWWEKLPAEERCRAAEYLGIPKDAPAEEAVQRMMRCAAASAADTVIFTVQDLSAAGSGARINTPSQIGGCWEYAAPPGFAPPQAAQYLRDLTRMYGRENKTLQCNAGGNDG